MIEKEKNAMLARKIVSSPLWRAEYFPEFFTDTFTMDFPSAPPGMPNHFDVWESERCFEWLNRTVKKSIIDLQEFYTTPDPNQFWAIGICRGNVIWGKKENHFQSKYFVRVEMKDGKINYMKGWMDTLAFLRAAYLQIPDIIKKVNDPRVEEFLANLPDRFRGSKSKDEKKSKFEAPFKDIDMSSKAIQQRLENNLGQNMCGIEREKYRRAETFHPEYKRDAWFIPDKQPWFTGDESQKSVLVNSEMEKHAPKELRSHIFAWVKLSSPWMYRDTRGINYPTDDEQVYFSEMRSKGPAMWVGNCSECGHYHQEYLMVMKFDQAGRELIREEVICPVNKYNSANISLPSFPYYY